MMKKLFLLLTAILLTGMFSVNASAEEDWLEERMKANPGIHKCAFLGDWGERREEGKPSTCIEAGFTGGSYCTRCGEQLSTPQPLPLAPHKYAEVITKATLTTDGSVTQICTVCGKQSEYESGNKIIRKPRSIDFECFEEDWDEEHCPVKNSMVYQGKALRPDVDIDCHYSNDYNNIHVQSSDYTITYTNNKNIGTATVTVNFDSKYYTGQHVLNFEILPKNTTLFGATTAKGRAITVKWKYKKDVDGYEIQYDTDDTFKHAKTINIKNKKKYASLKNIPTKKISKLKKNTWYYVRIRTYKDVNENGQINRYYSGWSHEDDAKTLKKAEYIGKYQLYVVLYDKKGYPYCYTPWGGEANMSKSVNRKTDRAMYDVAFMADFIAEENNRENYGTGWKSVGTYSGKTVVKRIPNIDKPGL